MTARTPLSAADLAAMLATGPDLPPTLARQQEPDAASGLSPVVDERGDRRYTDVAYARLAGFRPLVLDLRVPPADGPVPVVLYLHGGAFLWGSHHDPLFGVAEALADAGIATASAQYRLSGEAPFPAALHDVHAAIRWLRTVGPELGLDADRIGVMGESAGGFLAAFAGLRPSDPALVGRVGVVAVESRVDAVVGWYSYTGSLLAEHPDASIAAWASPRSHVTAHAAPMLLLHGDADDTVTTSNSSDLADELVDAGADATFEAVPGAGHVFAGADPSAAVARTAEFFAARLGA
ncbi:alpha/beta hydrolase fold domain-containing protein [Agromyces sp. NPDC058110]|uniref:alpha/beta hydrolase fold domain-containing protein n=1 Tax=Agromyces sp. NPDC058110 TaxID=3346345 RepID=UPI0036DBF722